jgi:DNA-binding transcriptional LysR family regulator
MSPRTKRGQPRRELQSPTASARISLDLTPLRYFHVIARKGSLTAAAEVLGLSQPTLSVAVQNFEERLGSTLFNRDPRGVSLTATGKELLRYAEEIFALLDRAEASVHSLETEDVGNFVIGCHEPLGSYFLPRFMREFLQAMPRVMLGIWNGPSRDVRNAVLSREVHFGLVVNPIPHEELVMVKLFSDTFDVFVSAEEPDRTLADAHERLRKGPLIHAGRVKESGELINRFAAEGLMPTSELSCGDFELVKSLALAGLGVALLPRRVAAYNQEGKLKRLHPELPVYPDSIYLIWRSDLLRTRAALKVKDLLVAHGRKLEHESNSQT